MRAIVASSKVASLDFLKFKLETLSKETGVDLGVDTVFDNSDFTGQIRNKGYSIILVDHCRASGLDGIAVVKDIRKLDRTTPIYVLSHEDWGELDDVTLSDVSHIRSTYNARILFRGDDFNELIEHHLRGNPQMYVAYTAEKLADSVEDRYLNDMSFVMGNFLDIAHEVAQQNGENADEYYEKLTSELLEEEAELRSELLENPSSPSILNKLNEFANFVHISAKELEDYLLPRYDATTTFDRSTTTLDDWLRAYEEAIEIERIKDVRLIFSHSRNKIATADYLSLSKTIRVYTTSIFFPVSSYGSKLIVLLHELQHSNQFRGSRWWLSILYGLICREDILEKSAFKGAFESLKKSYGERESRRMFENYLLDSEKVWERVPKNIVAEFRRRYGSDHKGEYRRRYLSFLDD